MWLAFPVILMRFGLCDSGALTSEILSSVPLCDSCDSPDRAQPADGRQPNGIEVLCIAAKKWLRRAGDVNPPVTVCNRAGNVAAGTHQGSYRPIDIDRSPGMTAKKRYKGERGMSIPR